MKHKSYKYIGKSLILTISFLFSIILYSNINSDENFIDALSCTGCSEWLSLCDSEIIEWAQNLLYSQDGNGNCNQWSEDCGTGQTMTRSGRVYIGGEISFTGSKLNVTKGIISKQLFICHSGWCDYVFEQDYDLLPLEKVQEFVEQNHHLPGIPSASEIEDLGAFSLDETALSHQEKIEEIFLHLIELEKNITNLETDLAFASKKNKEFKKTLNITN